MTDYHHVLPPCSHCGDIVRTLSWAVIVVPMILVPVLIPVLVPHQVSSTNSLSERPFQMQAQVRLFPHHPNLQFLQLRQLRPFRLPHLRTRPCRARRPCRSSCARGSSRTSDRRGRSTSRRCGRGRSSSCPTSFGSLPLLPCRRVFNFFRRGSICRFLLRCPLRSCWSSRRGYCC